MFLGPRWFDPDLGCNAARNKCTAGKSIPSRSRHHGQNHEGTMGIGERVEYCFMAAQGQRAALHENAQV